MRQKNRLRKSQQRHHLAQPCLLDASTAGILTAMKLLQFLILGSVLAQSPFSNAGLVCPTGSQKQEAAREKGEKEVWCQTDDGERNGIFVRYSAAGKIIAEGLYLLDQKQGRWRTYYESGLPKEESHWRSDRREGIYRSFFENQKIQVEGLYRRNWKSAIWKHHQPDGELKSFIDYGGSRFQIYGHYYGVRSDSDISHFTALDLTYRWPALVMDRLLVESALVIGWVEANESDYVVTVAPEFRLLWCLGPHFRIGPLVGYEQWPRLTSRGSFGGKISLIMRGTQGAELRNPSRAFNELSLTVKVLSKEYQIFMMGVDLWGF